MITIDNREEFVILTMARPQMLNALSRAMLDEFERALDSVEKSAARCLIIMGAGDKAFSAGADVSEFAEESKSAYYDRTVRGQALFGRLETLRQPSIALVNGYALGGGCELALAATFRVATYQAKFGLPEVKLGLVPGYGGTQRLPRLVGEPFALEIIMSGRMVDAEEALRLGLVNRILTSSEPALDQAIAYGRLFTGRSLKTQSLIRQAVSGSVGLSMAQGLDLEASLSAMSHDTDDAREGIAAFLAKRRPLFTDR